MMKKYEEYKESGSHWIGAIPISWNLSSLKNYVDFINGHAFKADNYVDKGVPIIRIGDVKQEINLDECKKINPEDYSDLERFTLKKEDILIALTGATIGKSGRYNKNELAYLNQRVGILRTRRSISQNFLYYIISSDFFQEFVRLQCDGAAQENIGTSDLGNFIIGFPPLPEQHQIASYLDHQTALIDALISKKEALIEQLKLQRQAVINEAVTRGLDENVKLVDSGVEWLGEIPEGWEVVKLKYVVEHSTLKGDGTAKYKVALENIESETGRFIETEEKEFEGEMKIFDKGDVLFNKLRPYLSKVLLADFNGECVSELLVFKAIETKMTNVYLHFLLSSQLFISIVDGSTYGAKMPRASVDFILNLEIPIPPIQHQKEIVEYSNKIKKSITKSMDALNNSITKLRLYRQSLISEAVTGKVDLRGWGS